MGNVYFVQGPDAGFIKIGYATGHPDRRFGVLQAYSPVLLKKLAVIPGPKAFERELHRRFAHLRRHYEWFEPAADLLGFIADEGRPWPDRRAEIEAAAAAAPSHPLWAFVDADLAPYLRPGDETRYRLDVLPSILSNRRESALRFERGSRRKRRV